MSLRCSAYFMSSWNIFSSVVERTIKCLCRTATCCECYHLIKWSLSGLLMWVSRPYSISSSAQQTVIMHQSFIVMITILNIVGTKRLGQGQRKMVLELKYWHWLSPVWTSCVLLSHHPPVFFPTQTLSLYTTSPTATVPPVTSSSCWTSPYCCSCCSESPPVSVSLDVPLIKTHHIQQSLLLCHRYFKFHEELWSMVDVMCRVRSCRPLYTAHVQVSLSQENPLQRLKKPEPIQPLKLVCGIGCRLSWDTGLTDWLYFACSSVQQEDSSGLNWPSGISLFLCLLLTQ